MPKHTHPRSQLSTISITTWEREHILKRQWLSIAHLSQLKDPGDYVNLELLGERISAVSAGDGVIKVLSRICAHRGMDVMPPEFGHQQ